MPRLDWEPICQFLNNPPILVDGRCDHCLQDPFHYDEMFICPQCGTRWVAPDYSPEGYASWTSHDPEGIPVMDRHRRGLGIYR